MVQGPMNSVKFPWKKNRGVTPRMEMAHSTPLKTNISLKKMMVERCISYCDSPFLGDMLIFGGVNKANTSRPMKTIDSRQTPFFWEAISPFGSRSVFQSHPNVSI